MRFLLSLSPEQNKIENKTKLAKKTAIFALENGFYHG
jgi:hypothetical protein